MVCRFCTNPHRSGAVMIEGLLVMFPLLVIMLIGLEMWQSRWAEQSAHQQAHYKVFQSATSFLGGLSAGWGGFREEKMQLNQAGRYALDSLPGSVIQNTTRVSYTSIFGGQTRAFTRQAALLRPSWTLKSAETENSSEAQSVQSWDKGIEYAPMARVEQEFHINQ